MEVMNFLVFGFPSFRKLEMKTSENLEYFCHFADAVSHASRPMHPQQHRL
jgi:hypothetical protein